MADLNVPAFVFGLPPQEAVRWFEAKGHRFSWNWQDTWQEANARSFTVAKVTRLDVLNDIRNAVAVALKEGKTERWFVQQLQPVLEEKGWWGKKFVVDPDGNTQRVQLGSPQRLRTIFRTNLQSAYMAGRWADMVRNHRARPYWMYVAVMDSRVRPTHAAMNGRVYRWDDPIWRTHFPPCAFNCRCRVRALTERQVQRMGVVVSDSRDQIETKKVPAGFDPRSGEVYDAEVTGIKLTGRDGKPITFFTDPGWSYNPGLSAYMPELDRYPTDVARQFVEGVLTGPEFVRWFSIWDHLVKGAVGQQSNAEARRTARSLARDRPEVRAAYDAAGLSGRSLPSGMGYPVGILTQADRLALKTPGQTVHMSSGTLIEHLGAHPEITLADYQRLPQLIQHGEVYQGPDDTRIVLLALDGVIYKSVLKVDQTRRKTYLLTLFRTNETSANRDVRSVLRRVR